MNANEKTIPKQGLTLNEGHIGTRATVEFACLLAEVAAALVSADRPREVAWCCEIAINFVEQTDIFERG